MSRYIDIDKAIPMMIQMCVDIVGHGITQVDAVRIATMLEDASVEDVAPKSEVDKWKEINEQLHKEMSERMIEERKIVRKLVARKIFEEIEKHLFVIAPLEEFDGQARLWLDDLMRIKKKYTEERTD